MGKRAAAGSAPGAILGPKGRPTVEGQPSELDLQEGFARIEAAVDEGNADLAGLGFWRSVGRVKRSPELVDRWAERIGAIDRRAFERSVRVRAPVWVGNAVLALGVL